jgi:hypothetical protein
MRLMMQRLPYLESLRCVLPLPQPGTLVFPNSLRSLDLEAEGSVSASVVGALVQAIGRIASLQDLTLRLQKPPAKAPLLRFGSLSAARNLTALSIYWPEQSSRVPSSSPEVPITDDQLRDLCSISSLRKLDLPQMDSMLVRLLGLAPASSRAERVLPLLERLDLEALRSPAEALLASGALASSLLELHGCPRWGTDADQVPRNLDWLRGFPLLSTLFLEDAFIPSLAPACAQGLHALTKLTSLTLRNSALTSSDLALCLAPLTMLRRLRLYAFRDLGGLSFLATAALAASLHDLSIKYCGELPVAELTHVRSLRQLQSLKLFGTLAGELELGAPELLPFAPPSQLLPNLTKFQFH